MGSKDTAYGTHIMLFGHDKALASVILSVQAKAIPGLVSILHFLHRRVNNPRQTRRAQAGAQGIHESGPELHVDPTVARRLDRQV
jgi:hypothetical protein